MPYLRELGTNADVSPLLDFAYASSMKVVSLSIGRRNGLRIPNLSLVGMPRDSKLSRNRERFVFRQGDSKACHKGATIGLGLTTLI